MTNTTLFIFLWFAFSLFNSFFSNRPYTHYLIVLLPSASLLAALIISTKQWRALATIMLISSVIIINSHFIIYRKTLGYYRNFLSLLSGNISVYNYRTFFDRNTPKDYDLAYFLRQNLGREDNVFIWGDNAQVYTLSDKVTPGRYAVSYHVLDYHDGLEVTKKALVDKKPAMIVIMKNATKYPFSLENYSERIQIGQATVYERIF